MLNKNKQTTYEVSPLTMAIVAIETKEGQIETEVYETDSTYLVKQTPFKLIDYACRFFGSSLRGGIEVVVHNGVLYEDNISYFY